MSVESVKEHFITDQLDLSVIEFEVSTATVELAAEALGVEPARIAKTMAFRLKDEDILVVTKGDVRVDNKKFKAHFGEKARFIKFEDVEEVTGHPVGGVCPFGLKRPLKIYLDESLKVFDIVYPAGGGTSTAVKIAVDYLEEVTTGQWLSVCQ